MDTDYRFQTGNLVAISLDIGALRFSDYEKSEEGDIWFFQLMPLNEPGVKLMAYVIDLLQ